MNLRAIYHLTGKFSTGCTGILFGQGRISNAVIKLFDMFIAYFVAKTDPYNQRG